ncbi:F-box protein CPR1-like [Papaver somniferum]|uniref:F-box protein CPR1-like n=1 Tax=Papaver somniferum TaxID=3469 RepID=UPI000E6F46B5|nr:F-box protein CPR1-like [Papaver somniferum]
MSSIPVPEDILTNILLRLPFKSVSLCRCFCKFWYTLLSIRSFVRVHYDLAVEKNYPNIVLIRANLDRKHVFYSMTKLASECDKRLEIRCPFETKGKVEILGSSNGLLSIRVGEHFDESVICIWNPTTKEYKRVLKSPINQFPCDLVVHDYRIAYGFCYDSKIDDYKLIKVVGFIGVPSRSGVQVYHLGSNSWSTHQFIPYYFPCKTSRSGITVHGSLHWLGKPGVETYSQESPDTIVSFDICEERFDVLAFPATAENEDVIKAHEIGILDGCLCLIIQELNSRLDLWVLFTTSHELLVHHPVRSNFLVNSLENGEFLLAIFESFILYNPRHDTDMTIPGTSASGSGEVESSYSTSLFSLNSRTHVGEDDKTVD